MYLYLLFTSSQLVGYYPTKVSIFFSVYFPYIFKSTRTLPPPAHAHVLYLSLINSFTMIAQTTFSWKEL